MATYLKLRRVSLTPETFMAMEYSSDIYVSWARAQTLPDVQWQSDPLSVDELIALLVSRGWHQTDIGDELDEALEFTGPKA